MSWYTLARTGVIGIMPTMVAKSVAYGQNLPDSLVVGIVAAAFWIGITAVIYPFAKSNRTAIPV